MVILITISILLFTATVLLGMRVFQVGFRFSWLAAAFGGLLAWASVFVWLTDMPTHLQFSIWQPALLFSQSPTFVTDSVAWLFATSMVTLNLAVIITSVVRSNFPSPLSWVGTFVLSAFGVLAVAADNPLTLVLIWAAIDLAELAIQLRFVEDPSLSERVVISFASRLTGTMVLLWANSSATANGEVLDFHSATSRVGLLLLIAAALRIGVLPLHLPYPGESALRRGFGTALRAISAGSSLILLARIPAGSISSPFAPFLLLLVALAALYGGWMWLRAPDELSGRPFWVIGFGSLAVASTLLANPVGAAAWSCALILGGGALFLSSEPNKWLLRALWIAVFGISALPFSMTSSGWSGERGRILFLIPLIPAHAMLMAGFIRHTLRPPSTREIYEDQPLWAKNIYPVGLILLLATIFLVGMIGWDGALQLGNVFAGLVASVLTFGLLWSTPRLRILNPVRAHWVSPTNPTWLDMIYGSLWNVYRQLGSLSRIFSNLLEGDSGIMWTLLFLALFISFFTQGTP
jgi:hypothetical protein